MYTKAVNYYMAITTLLQNIERSSSYPKIVNVSSPNGCGIISLVLDTSHYSEQMLYELPSISIFIYALVGDTYTFYDSRALQIDVDNPEKPVSAVIRDIPKNCMFYITPQFDDNALHSHNMMTRTLYSESTLCGATNNDIWTTPTEIFPITISYDNSSLVSGDSSSSEGGSSDGTNVDLTDYITYTQSVDKAGMVLKVNDTGRAVFTDISDSLSDTGITEEFTSNVSVGGVKEGTTFAEGVSCTHMFKSILIAKIPPKVTLEISPPTELYEKGESVSNITMTATLVKNTDDITECKFLVGGTVVDTVTGSAIQKGGTVSYTYSGTVTANTTFSVEVTDGENIVTDSKTITFIAPYYYGVSETNSIVDVSNLTKRIDGKENQTVLYTANGEYVIFMYDATYPDLIEIEDINGFNYLGSFVKSLTTIGNNAYKVYISTYPTTNNNFEYTFKFGAGADSDNANILDTVSQLYVPISSLATVNGVATLDSNGTLVEGQIPESITNKIDRKLDKITSSTKPTNVGEIGDIVFNSAPEPSGYVGWVYTALGWFGFGLIEDDVSDNAFITSDGQQFILADGTPFLYADSQ